MIDSERSNSSKDSKDLSDSKITDESNQMSIQEIIDNQFVWCFSLITNDLIRLKFKDRDYFGYFAGLDRSGGSINILVHDRSTETVKDGLIRGIGVRRALEFSKMAVDVLGNIYTLPQEPR